MHRARPLPGEPSRRAERARLSGKSLNQRYFLGARRRRAHVAPSAAARSARLTASGIGVERIPSGASGSVPADGAARLASVLERLGGRRIVVHGTGQHTKQLAHVLAGSPARIVALADDDRQEHGTTVLSWPVVAPRDAGATGATDVVISSWINQGVIWNRRAVYERQGLTVHRLYD